MKRYQFTNDYITMADFNTRVEDFVFRAGMERDAAEVLVRDQMIESGEIVGCRKGKRRSRPRRFLASKLVA